MWNVECGMRNVECGIQVLGVGFTVRCRVIGRVSGLRAIGRRECVESTAAPFAKKPTETCAL